MSTLCSHIRHIAMDLCLQSSTLHLESESCTYETLVSPTEGCNCVGSVNWVLWINACIAICCRVVMLCTEAPSSEVSALAYPAVPATIECHVI